MGQVKRFAAYLAECVYLREMSNGEIIVAVKASSSDDNRDDEARWIDEQIQVVRNNPDIFRGMVE